MTTQQAYIKGFVKRAAEYGYSEDEAIELYKRAFSFSDLGQRLGGAADRGMQAVGDTFGKAYHSVADPIVNTASRAYHGVADPLVEAGRRIGSNVSKAYHDVADPIESWWNATKTPADLNLAVSRARMGDKLDSLSGSNSPGISPMAGGLSLGGGNAQQPNSGGPLSLSLGGANKVSLNGPSALPGKPQQAQPQQAQPQQAASAAPQPAMAPPQASQPANPQSLGVNPSNTQFNRIMGGYNPKSQLNQAKAQRIRELYSQGITSPKAIYADKGYGSITPQSIRRP